LAGEGSAEGIGMVHTHWLWFGCFTGGVLAVALYGLTASGHFPGEARSERLKGGSGALVLWGTLAVTALAAAGLLLKAWWVLPWHLAVIGGGAMLLFAPLLLQPLPNSFVDGRRGLIAFSAAAAVLAGLMWVDP
jgi:hypothetical protein